MNVIVIVIARSAALLQKRTGTTSASMQAHFICAVCTLQARYSCTLMHFSDSHTLFIIRYLAELSHEVLCRLSLMVHQVVML